MSRNREYLRILGPWLEGTVDDKGERNMHCPYHDDNTRSASVNLDKKVFVCHACGASANTKELIAHVKSGNATVPSGSAKASGRRKTGRSGKDRPILFQASVDGWHASLFDHRTRLEYLQNERGLDVAILQRYEIGWALEGRGCFTIPIRDRKGELVNIRRYSSNPTDDRRKIWSVEGLGQPRLYPYDQLAEDTLVLCEGEWDALACIQRGIPAITRTGAARVWKSNWNHLFDGKQIFICHDMDKAGQAANLKVAMALRDHAKELRIIHLPYEVTPKHGKDITDYWLEGHTPDEFFALVDVSDIVHRDSDDEAPVYVTVQESFDARYVSKRVTSKLTIVGKKTTTYLTPRKVEYTCNQAAGAKCAVCPMNKEGHDGHVTREIDPWERHILAVMAVPDSTRNTVLTNLIGVPGGKCVMLEMDIQESTPVEELVVRSQMETGDNQEGQHQTRSIKCVGHHDTLPNNDVSVEGIIHASPKTQENEFLVYKRSRAESSIDKFQVTEEMLPLLELFQPREGQRPINKVMEIAKDLAANVTHIYGRWELHALMALVYHSVLSFSLGEVHVERGWLDALIVGDTRTGKSRVAQALIRHFGAGEWRSCESASFAGIIGGLQQVGGKEWTITWGAAPLNDRRLLVLDEVSGLHTSEIAQMSSVRSSGFAELTKIKNERAWARTRLIWLGNPRDGKKMSNYTYGVQAIPPLIGNNEDVARFDLAMSVSSSDVSGAEILTPPSDPPPHVHTGEACHAMLMWCWSRKSDQVVISDSTLEEARAAATALGARYIEDPPLIQVANVIEKVMRVAVAIAAYTGSTDDTWTKVIVKPQHVRDAQKFIERLYANENFGYRQTSRERLEELAMARASYEECKGHLRNTPGMVKFLRNNSSFRSQDMRDMMDLDMESVTHHLNKFWNWGMLRRNGAQNEVEEELHKILRELT